MAVNREISQIEFLKAAAEGDGETVNSYILSRIESAPRTHGSICISIAPYDKNLRDILGVTNHNGENALHLAAKNGHYKIVLLLLRSDDQYHDSDTRDASYYYPYCYSYMHLAKDFDGMTPLMTAALGGQEETVKALLDAPELKKQAATRKPQEVLRLQGLYVQYISMENSAKENAATIAYKAGYPAIAQCIEDKTKMQLIPPQIRKIPAPQPQKKPQHSPNMFKPVTPLGEEKQVNKLAVEDEVANLKKKVEMLEKQVEILLKQAGLNQPPPSYKIDDDQPGPPPHALGGPRPH